MTSSVADTRELTQDAGRAAAGGSVISRVFAGTLAVQIADALTDARKSADDDAGRFGLDAAIDRVRVLTCALGTPGVPDQSAALSLAGSIASELNAARAAYGHVARTGTLGTGFDPSFVTHLDRARAGAQVLTEHLARTRNRHADPRPRAEITRARGTAGIRGLRKMLAVAALLLPGEYRAQYAEEYLSELWDLAQSGDGRLSQLRYAVRQLLCVISISRTLRSPRCRRTLW